MIFFSKREGERGDVAIYMALMVLAIMLSTVLLLNTLLVRQLRATDNAIDSERAFYAANAGIERGLYELSLFATTDTITFDEEIVYDGGIRAIYQGEAKYGADGLSACISSIGAYPVRDGEDYPDNAPQALERRLRLGPSDC